MILLIIGGLFVEIATIVGSSAISLKLSFKLLNLVGERGQKIDTNVLEQFSEPKNKWQKKLGKLLSLLPGINLALVTWQYITLPKKFLNSKEIKYALVSMDDSEKRIYDRTEGNLKKASYVASISKEYTEMLDSKPNGFYVNVQPEEIDNDVDDHSVQENNEEQSADYFLNSLFTEINNEEHNESHDENGPTLVKRFK